MSRSVDAIATFHQEHQQSASPLQRGLAAAIDLIGHPLVVVLLLVAIGGWVGATFLMTDGSPSQPALLWLELCATVSALIVALLILTTQRHQDRLANRMTQLTLELAILADQRSAKAIALLEELRRDQPDVANRDDAESSEMAVPVDPGAVLAAIDQRVPGGNKPA